MLTHQSPDELAVPRTSVYRDGEQERGTALLTVRNAAWFSDVSAAFELTKQHMLTSPTQKKLVPDWDKFVALAVRAMNDSQGQTALVLIHEKHGLVGFLYAFARPLPYVEDAVITNDLILIIDKDYRSFRALKLLTDAYVDWARSIGAIEARLGIVSGIETDRLARCYDKLGFKQLGTLHSKEL